MLRCRQVRFRLNQNSTERLLSVLIRSKLHIIRTSLQCNVQSIADATTPICNGTVTVSSSQVPTTHTDNLINTLHESGLDT